MEILHPFKHLHFSLKFMYTANYSPKAAQLLSSLFFYKKAVTNSLGVIWHLRVWHFSLKFQRQRKSEVFVLSLCYLPVFSSSLEGIKGTGVTLTFFKLFFNAWYFSNINYFFLFIIKRILLSSTPAEQKNHVQYYSFTLLFFFLTNYHSLSSGCSLILKFKRYPSAVSKIHR